MKFYAVYCGRQPGIYRSWKECQSQVTGYSGAIFKSFKTLKEAKDFLGETEEFKSTASSHIKYSPPSSFNLLKAYVDGSHIKGSNRLGYGILCQYNDQEYALSCHHVTSASLREVLGKSLTLSHLSNPTMEFIAVTHLLSLVASDESKRFHRLEIYYDYIGSEKWINGSWKPRQTHIQAIYDSAMPHIACLKSIGVKIDWIHVPAHSGHRENDIADALAKGELSPQNNAHFQHISKLFPSSYDI